jgi:hypothetical protein
LPCWSSLYSLRSNCIENITLPISGSFIWWCRNVFTSCYLAGPFSHAPLFWPSALMSQYFYTYTCRPTRLQGTCGRLQHSCQLAVTSK